MKSTTRTWLKAAAATVGVGALTFGAVLPATAADDSNKFVVNADKYALASAQTGFSSGALKSLEKAGEIKVLNSGTVLHIDKPGEAKGMSTLEQHAAAEGAAIPSTPEQGSRPGAPVTVYLDFDGENVTGTLWNDVEGIGTIEAAPSGASADFRADVWAAVAEDYAPFNVNVTTKRPSDDKLYKSSVDDNEYGSHVIVTDSQDDILPESTGDGASGVAFLGATGSEFKSGAFVFVPQTAGGNAADAVAKSVADTASHESGHNFGLMHDGNENAPVGEREYYYPRAGVWGPIMGATYDVPVSQWSKGEYAGASSDQDDLAEIANRGIRKDPLAKFTLPNGDYWAGDVCTTPGVTVENIKPGDQAVAYINGACDENTPLTLHFTFVDRADAAQDGVGNDAAGAAALENPGTFKAAGVIETSADVDVFRVYAGAGDFTAKVEVADVQPNLDAKLTLTDASGEVIDTDNPASEAVSFDTATGLGAAVSATVPAGVYYLSIDGVGAGDPSTATPENANGYTGYGSLGNYTLSGAAEELQIDPVVITTPADGAEVEGASDIPVTGTATADAKVTVTVGGTAVTTTADAEGKWATTVKTNEYGNTVIVASQKVGTIDVAETDTVTVTAPVDAPVIKAPADGSTTEDTTPTVSGTGIAGATVTVTLSNGVTGTATVDGAGNWTFDVPSELGAGAYTATATQAINGADSANSNSVDFIVKVVVPTTPPTTTPTTPPTTADADADGNGGDDDNLATTGGDFDAMPITLLAAGVLMAAGVTAIYAARQRRKASSES